MEPRIVPFETAGSERPAVRPACRVHAPQRVTEFVIAPKVVTHRQKPLGTGGRLRKLLLGVALVLIAAAAKRSEALLNRALHRGDFAVLQLSELAAALPR